MTDTRPTQPEALVRDVFRRVRSGISPAELYADDAVLTSMDGQRHEGIGAITEFYRNVVEVTKTQPNVETVFVNLPLVLALIRAQRPDGGESRVVDVFTVEGGELTSMRICPEGEQ